MNFKAKFNQLFSRNKETAEPIDDSETNDTTDWDSLSALNPDQGATSFDDLANVPFAGVASSTEFSVEPEQRLKADLAIAGSEEMAFSNNASEAQESTSSPEVQALKNFFKTDLRIKRELIQTAPSLSDDYDESSRMDYVEQAYRTFKDFRTDFAQIERDFGFGSGITEQTDAFFQRGAEHFALSNYDSGVTTKIYRDEFTDLRRDFIEKVKDECVGYKLLGSLTPLISDAHSINELLHAYHSYIMNNENILQAVPALAEKENSQGNTITLRGDQANAARQVFDALPADLSIGPTDIIAAGENLMMMVRDRGHALTLNATPDRSQPNQMWVEYNIPKICNIEMIKQLPGLSGYSEHGAQGGFMVAQDELGTKITDFISQVPTDNDMFKEGGALYRGDL